jgi:hypothetical protein
MQDFCLSMPIWEEVVAEFSLDGEDGCGYYKTEF